MTRNGHTYCLLCLYLLCLMSGCAGDGTQMRQELEALEQQNRSGEQMLNDSLAESLVAYFDRHGTANERMRAKYILGRTYYCLGELPRALETYYEAADCADTTATNCNFKVLSRIYAQRAMIFYDQIQPRSLIMELNCAEFYAWKGRDTLQAIECFSMQSDAYDLLKCPDSVIIICERSSELFKRFGREDRSAQMKGRALSSLIKKKDFGRLKQFIYEYESFSNLFEKKDSIISGHEIYYYLKGLYYVTANQLDSAEYMFRKELRNGKDLNNQIAACVGLQRVYDQRKNSDSIAKYASLSYELNDSAYSLSEMQNVQKMQASYNYSHNKLLAEQNALKVERSKNILFIVIALFLVLILFGYYMFSKYKGKKEKELINFRNDLQSLEKIQTELQDICSEESLSPVELFEKRHKEITDILNRVVTYKRKVKQTPEMLEQRLDNSYIVVHLRDLAEANPYQTASIGDFKNLRELINSEIPHFYTTLNTPKYTLTPIEYEVSMLLRVHFSPIEIHRLTGASPSYISNMRSRLLLKIWGIHGSPKDYDERILSIN